MMNQTTMAVPEWPEEWTSRPIVVLDEHASHHLNTASYGLAYGGPSEPIPFEEWERDPASAIGMEFMPSFTDAYGYKRVMPEHMNPVESELQSTWAHSVAPCESHEWQTTSLYPVNEETVVAQEPQPTLGPLHAGLLAQIGNLDLATRQRVVQLVDQLQPGIVQKQAGDWSFSINHLTDATVAQIYHALAAERAAPETSWSVPEEILPLAEVDAAQMNSPKRAGAYADLEAHWPRSKRFKLEDTSDECSSEDSISDYTASLDDHSLAGASDEFLTCNICRRCFHGTASLNKHMRTHHDERSFSCTHPGCTKKFSHSSTLKDHMNIHLQRKPYTCKECGKGFPNGSNLNRHARIHTKSKPYVCPVCNKAFSQSSNLRVHQKIHERPSSKND